MCGKDNTENFWVALIIQNASLKNKNYNKINIISRKEQSQHKVVFLSPKLRRYKDSFRAAVQAKLKPAIKDQNAQTVEDAHNVLRHILSKVFQFLYISVYREVKFEDVFANADPYVFHSAVGIKKEDFEILNRYNVFQEKVLDAYIHEFFVNESLGKSLETVELLAQDSYRNSFNWFGYGLE